MSKPDAYLVAKGRAFCDTAYMKQEYAEERIAARKDGSVMLPLYAIDAETRDALKAASMQLQIENQHDAASNPFPEYVEANNARIALRAKHIALIERLTGEEE